MGGLLKSVQTISHSAEGRNISSGSSPSANHEHHITVGQVSRDFSSVGTEGHDRSGTVAFLVGNLSHLQILYDHASYFHCFPEKVGKGSFQCQGLEFAERSLWVQVLDFVQWQ